jgi:hypothetical protein
MPDPRRKQSQQIDRPDRQRNRVAVPGGDITAVGDIPRHGSHRSHLTFRQSRQDARPFGLPTADITPGMFCTARA